MPAKTPQLFPHIKYIMDKFRNKLPKEDLKKFAKEIGKKLVASDFKNNRVEDPTKISTKQEKKVKKYVKEFFEKAVAKKAAHDKMKAAKKPHSSTNGTSIETIPNGKPSATEESDAAIKAEELDDIEMSDDEESGNACPSVPATPSLLSPNYEGLKRKCDDMAESYDSTPSESPIKRMKEEDPESEPTPPPPPPPPPAEEMSMLMDEDADLAAQEEALMRENEEALMKENEEAMKEAELLKIKSETPLPGSIDDVDMKINGVGTEKSNAEDKTLAMKEVNGNAVVKMESSATDSKDGVKHLSESNGVEEKRDIMQHERKEVLSH